MLPEPTTHWHFESLSQRPWLTTPGVSTPGRGPVAVGPFEIPAAEAGIMQDRACGPPGHVVISAQRTPAGATHRHSPILPSQTPHSVRERARVATAGRV